MTKKVKKNLIPIDWNEVNKYIECGAKGTEVASALGMHPDTLYKRCNEEHGMVYTAYSATKRQKGDLMLHAKQYQVAMNGNTTMLIWLGKQRLGQLEQPRNNEEFSGSLSVLLQAMHSIKDSGQFKELINTTCSSKDAVDTICSSEEERKHDKET